MKQEMTSINDEHPRMNAPSKSSEDEAHKRGIIRGLGMAKTQLIMVRDRLQSSNQIDQADFNPLGKLAIEIERLIDKLKGSQNG